MPVAQDCRRVKTRSENGHTGERTKSDLEVSEITPAEFEVWRKRFLSISKLSHSLLYPFIKIVGEGLVPAPGALVDAARKTARPKADFELREIRETYERLKSLVL